MFFQNLRLLVTSNARGVWQFIAVLCLSNSNSMQSVRMSMCTGRIVVNILTFNVHIRSLKPNISVRENGAGWALKKL